MCNGYKLKQFLNFVTVWLSVVQSKVRGRI